MEGTNHSQHAPHASPLYEGLNRVAAEEQRRGRSALPPRGILGREAMHRLKREEHTRSLALVVEFVKLRDGDVTNREMAELMRMWGASYNNMDYGNVRKALNLPRRCNLPAFTSLQMRRRHLEMERQFRELLATTPDEQRPCAVVSLANHARHREAQRLAIESATPLYRPNYDREQSYKAARDRQRAEAAAKQPTPAAAPAPVAATAPAKRLGDISDEDLAAEIERRRAALREQLKLLGG